MVCITSKRGDVKDIKNALQEYSEKAKNRKPSIKVRLAQAKKQLATLNAKNLAKDLTDSIPKQKMPLPKM